VAQQPRLIDDLDDLSITIEKLECLLSVSPDLAGETDEERQMSIIMAIVRDYVHELKIVSRRLSEHEMGVCR
jgi:hypothetical protein